MKGLLVLILFTFSGIGYSQSKDLPALITKEDLLKKSKRQQRTGWLMLGGGTLVAVGSMYWALEAYANESGSGDHGQGYFFISGVCSIVGSIPMFIISGNNKKKAMSMSIGPGLPNKIKLRGGVTNARNYPVISLRIDIN